MNILASPSAVLFILGLCAVVALQAIGDARQMITNIKKRKSKKQTSKPKAVNYLTSGSWQAAFRASHQALLHYKSRVTGETVPKLRKNFVMRVSWPIAVAAISILSTVILLEGLMAGCILILVYLVFMSVVGILAWPKKATQSVSEELAIALLAPFSVFFRYN